MSHFKETLEQATREAIAFAQSIQTDDRKVLSQQRKIILMGKAVMPLLLGLMPLAGPNQPHTNISW